MSPDTELVYVSPSILSSYSEKPLVQLGEAGRAPQDVADALLALCTALPWLRITELQRAVATQAAARRRYENWLTAGKPAPYVDGKPNPKFNAKTMKADFVAKPGKSMHNGGRAIDVNIETLKKHFGAQYLDAFWPIAAKYGFTPVIAKPTEGVSESWHFDHWGPWARVKDSLGYEQAALCAAVVVGEAGDWQSGARVTQALLLRAGYAIGEPDGILGRRSYAALDLALGVGWSGDPVPRLRALPVGKAWVTV